MARALNNLGTVATVRGDFAGACQLFSESLSLYRDAGDRWGAAGALIGLAVANHRQGDAPRAVALLEESLSLYDEVGDRRSAALAALNLADALRDSGDLTQAGVHYRDALVEFGAFEDRPRVAEALLGLGSVMMRASEFERAAKLLGAASALTTSEEPGSGDASPEIAGLTADRDTIRGALGEVAFRSGHRIPRTFALPREGIDTLSGRGLKPSHRERCRKAGSRGSDNGKGQHHWGGVEFPSRTGIHTCDAIHEIHPMTPHAYSNDDAGDGCRRSTDPRSLTALACPETHNEADKRRGSLQRGDGVPANTFGDFATTRISARRQPCRSRSKRSE
jgi:hypothetical protein